MTRTPDTDSDTESESQGSIYGYDANEFAHISTFQPSYEQDCSQGVKPSAHAVHLVAEGLRSLDLGAVQQDESLHDMIGHASTTILGFLDNFEPSSHIAETEATMRVLLDSSFISLLFAYRQVFHNIAARDVAKGGVSSTIVCWVDVVLARLGEAIVAFAGQNAGTEGTCLSTLQRQREADALRAATQLPDQWSTVPNLLSAEYASPAATRLALRLLFGVYVMGIQLGCVNSWQGKDSQRINLLNSLKAYIERISIPEDSAVISSDHDVYSQVALHMRNSYAMFISLFAALDSSGKSDEPLPYRPHTHNKLLHLITTITCPDQPLSLGVHCVTPRSVLDTAQVIFLQWGPTVAWCWSLRSDPRIAHAEVIDYVTATWMYHIGIDVDNPDLDKETPSPCQWDEVLIASLAENPTAAASAMIRLFHHVLSSLLAVPPVYPSLACQHVIHKACWAAVQLLRASNDHLDDTTLGLCSALIKLFILLPQDDSDSMVKDLIIEALSSMSAATLQHVMKDICDDVKLNLPMRLDENLSSLNRWAVDQDARDSCAQEELYAIRQLLQFISLMTYSQVQGCFGKEAISSFLHALADWLVCISSHSSYATLLRDALIVAFAAVEITVSTSIKKSWDDATIWQIAMEGRCTDLATASAFAAYVSAGIHQQRIDSLTQAEAFNYFRDVLLLVLTRQFHGSEESSAILACSSLCQALTSLISHADENAKQYMLSSPWTMNLCIEIRTLIESGGKDGSSYSSDLRDRALPSLKAFMKTLNLALHLKTQEECVSSTSANWNIQCNVTSVTRLVFTLGLDGG